MTRRVWRIVRARHLAGALTGEGAARFGGRWNSRGVRLVYASSTRSLAALEILVHLGAERPAGWVALPLEVPVRELTRLDPAELPTDWRDDPPPSSTRQLGDAFVAAGRGLALEVPSAVIPGETNLLLNPGHPSFAQVVAGPAEPFEFDPRLAGRRGPG